MGSNSKTQREHEALMETLREMGATDVELHRTGKHKRLHWKVNGKPFAYSLSCTPSCPYSNRNALARCKRLTQLALDGVTI